MPGNTGRIANPPGQGIAGFNEAPAKCRGIPRNFAQLDAGQTRFNEAPAKCRGILAQGNMRFSKLWGFNEAPAKCRGIQGAGDRITIAKVALQ